MDYNLYKKALTLGAVSMFLVGCSNDEQDAQTDRDVIEGDFDVEAEDVEFGNNDEFEKSDEDFSEERQEVEQEVEENTENDNDQDVESPEDE